MAEIPGNDPDDALSICVCVSEEGRELSGRDPEVAHLLHVDRRRHDLS